MSAEPGLTDSTEYRRLHGLITPSNGGRKLYAGPLKELAGYRAAVDELTVRMIHDYREAHWTYEAIGAALGITKQAVSQLHKRARRR